MPGSRPTRGLLLGGAALVAVLALALWQPAVARALAACLLVLVLPGLAITAATFPPGRLHGAEWAAFSLGASLAVAAVGGLLLHLTPWGLTIATWVMLLGGITLAAGAVAARRWRRAAAQEAAGPGGPLAAAWADMAAGRWEAATRRLEALAALESIRPPRLPLGQGLMLGAAVLVTVAAVGVARTGAADAPRPGFSQLWLVPSEGTPTSVWVGVRNSEWVPRSYRVALEVAGEEIGVWPAVTLGSGESWQTLVRLPPPGGILEARRPLLGRVPVSRSPEEGDQVRAVLTPLGDPAGAAQWVSLWRSYEPR